VSNRRRLPAAAWPRACRMPRRAPRIAGAGDYPSTLRPVFFLLFTGASPVSCPGRARKRESRDPGAPRRAVAREHMALRTLCAGSRISFRSRKCARCTRPGRESGYASTHPRPVFFLLFTGAASSSLRACPHPVPPPQAGEGTLEPMACRQRKLRPGNDRGERVGSHAPSASHPGASRMPSLMLTRITCRSRICRNGRRARTVVTQNQHEETSCGHLP
jgi:hypothetical protein